MNLKNNFSVRPMDWGWALKWLKIMQGVIFRENSGKVDEYFSLFFVKNFTEIKESHFGYFFGENLRKLD